MTTGADADSSTVAEIVDEASGAESAVEQEQALWRVRKREYRLQLREIAAGGCAERRLGRVEPPAAVGPVLTAPDALSPSRLEGLLARALARVETASGRSHRAG